MGPTRFRQSRPLSVASARRLNGDDASSDMQEDQLRQMLLRPSKFQSQGVAFALRAVYVALMSRTLTASSAILLFLLPAIAFAAPVQKRHIYHWHGYGFLPGYHQPPSNSVPIYGPKGAIGDGPDAPSYFYNGGWYYYGRPGFFRGHYNGGSFGPCWTWTPIGPMWNCG